MEIDWEKTPSPQITLKVIGESGRIAFRHLVRLSELSSSKANDKLKWTTCLNPRPEVCTQDSRPVCAKLEDGGVKSYSNGCSACADPNVNRYRKGACEKALKASYVSAYGR